MSNPKKYYLSFQPDVKKAILADAVLLTELADNIETNILALGTMFKRNSQSLMHISLLKIISKKLKIEVKDLTCKATK